MTEMTKSPLSASFDFYLFEGSDIMNYIKF